jgi:bleomycin hydrolase
MSEKDFYKALIECSNDELAILLSMNHSKSKESLTLPLDSNKRTLYSQGKTGTCWLSSALLCISLYLKNRKGIEITEETSFSKSYLLFYDKIERTEWFLSLIESNINDEQRMRYILNHLMTDRGQWNMAKNLIMKYGLIPYRAMPDPFHRKSLVDLNTSISNMLKLYALHLKKKPSVCEKDNMKNTIMNTVKRMLVDLLGEPPTEIDVPDIFQCENKISPKSFFHDYIEFPFDDYLFVCNFAPENNSFYEVTLDNNILDGMPEILLNLSDDDFHIAIYNQLKRDGFCWYTCDATKGFCLENNSFDDPDIYKVISDLSRSDLIRNRLSAPNHAMVLIGDDHYLKGEWLLSHNSKSGLNNGLYIPVSKTWLNKYAFQAIVHKSCITLDYLHLPYYHIMPFDLFFSI